MNTALLAIIAVTNCGGLLLNIFIIRRHLAWHNEALVLRSKEHAAYLKAIAAPANVTP